MKVAELVRELERIFGSGYRPSPGGLYPALHALAGEGLLDVDRDGRGKRYRITDTGARALADRRRELAALEARTKAQVRAEPVDELREHVEKFVERVGPMVAVVGIDAVADALGAAAEQLQRLGGQHAHHR